MTEPKVSKRRKPEQKETEELISLLAKAFQETPDAYPGAAHFLSSTLLGDRFCRYPALSGCVGQDAFPDRNPEPLNSQPRDTDQGARGDVASPSKPFRVGLLFLLPGFLSLSRKTRYRY